MTVSLAPELKQFVDDMVREGKFPSFDAAISEAVQLMKEREEQLAWLRKEIQLGIDDMEQGNESPWDVEEMKAELFRELEGK